LLPVFADSAMLTLLTLKQRFRRAFRERSPCCRYGAHQPVLRAGVRCAAAVRQRCFFIEAAAAA